MHTRGFYNPPKNFEQSKNAKPNDSFLSKKRKIMGDIIINDEKVEQD